MPRESGRRFGQQLLCDWAKQHGYSEFDSLLGSAANFSRRAKPSRLRKKHLYKFSTPASVRSGHRTCTQTRSSTFRPLSPLADNDAVSGCDRSFISY